MLKKRILASSMASVMALTSVSLVAFADDTDYLAVETVTKANLNDMVAGLIAQTQDGIDVNTFKTKKIYEFGQKMSGYLRDALDYVTKVTTGGTTYDDTDATAAYQMMVAVVERAVIHTAEDLQNLMDSAKDVYDGKNKLNAYSDDLIYTAPSYQTFKNAYDRAKTVVKSTSSSAITDAYVTLEEAISGLDKKTQVSKAEFDKALADYEASLDPVKYDAWRRGYISINKSDIKTSNLYNTYNGLDVAWGTLVNHVAYVLPDAQTSQQTLNNIKGVSVTTDDTIVANYKKLLDGKTILDGFVADDTEFAVKYTIEELLEEYQTRLAADFEKDQLEAVIGAIDKLDGASDGGFEFKGTATTATSGSLTAATVAGTVEKKYNNKRLASASLTVGVAAGKTATLCYATDSDGKLLAYYDTAVKYAIAKDETTLRTAITGKKVVVNGTASTKDVDLNTLVFHTLKDGTAPVNLLEILRVNKDKIGSYTPGDANQGSVTGEDTNEDKYHLSNGVIDGDTYANANDKDSSSAVGVPTDGTVIDDENVDRGFELEYKSGAWKARATLLNTKDDGPDFKGAGSDKYTGTVDTVTDATGKVGISWADKDTISSIRGGITSGKLTYPGKWLTYPQFSKAMRLALSYLDVDWAAKTDTNLDEIEDLLRATVDTKGTFSSNTVTKNAAGTQDKDNTHVKYDFTYDSSDLSTIIYRYLKYALEDRYAPEKTESHHTRPEIEELVVKADELTAKCVEAPIFSAAVKALAEARQHSRQWLAASYNDYLYEDNGSAPLGVKVDKEWTDLDGKYNALLDLYNEWKYSYDEIVDTINEVAAAIEADDANVLVVSDALKEALSECAYDLSLVKPDQKYGIYNAAFDNARNFNGINRLHTKSNSNDPTHIALTESYEALLDAVEAAQPGEAQGTIGDVNADGKVNATDALAILKYKVGLLTDDDTFVEDVADYNADGKVNSSDALDILKDKAAGLLD